MSYKLIFFTLVMALAWNPAVLSAADSNGSQDHPLVGRHPDATLHKFSKQDYAEYRQLAGPLGDVTDECCDIDETQTPLNRLRGELTRIVYSVPDTVSTLELYESHRQSLQKAGYEMVFECVDSACGKIHNYDFLNERLNVAYGLSYLAARSPDGKTHVSLAFVPESPSSDTWEYAVDVVENRPLINRIQVLPPEPATSAPPSAPEPLAPDVSDSRDHPLFPRHPSASIHRYSYAEFDQYRQLLGPVQVTGCCDVDLEKTRSKTLQGKLTRILYRLPLQVTALEVMDSFQQSLKDSSYETLFQCKDSDCGAYLQFDTFEPRINAVLGLRYIAAASADGRVHVSIAFPDPNSSSYNEFALTVLEKSDMQNRITVLSPEALKSALDETGKAVLGGIFFEHDSATLKPSSDQALEQVASMMNSHPEVKIFVVGHTDNLGDLSYNRDLSSRRAQAVADRLTRTFNVSEERLEGFGVASLAPQASNVAEKGRARNRRVELVLQ